MPKRRHIIILIIATFVIIDGLAWWTTYRVVTAPPPEALQAQAAASKISTSQVELMWDNFTQRVSLNGSWQYKQTGSEDTDYFAPELDTSDWHTMDIPQNWYLVGLNYHGVVWFRHSFQAEAAWQGRATQLTFEGVDYFADVWLNGHKLGHHEGYFQPFTFDITDRLNYGGENLLVVRVDSPYEEYGTVWPFRKTLIKGILSHHDTRPGGGWSPVGQEYNTGGIWKDVSLTVSDFMTVEDIDIQATWPTSVTVGVDPWVSTDITLRNFADTTVEAEVTLTFTPRNFEGESISLPQKTVGIPRGETKIQINGTTPKIQLWWPWDRGNPSLYTARIEVQSNGKIIAEKETTFGFRQIQVDEAWNWVLNGRRFFPRGSNYISSQWLSETDATWFERDVALMREANLNFIRVHAHVEPVEFYQAADEAGILVWQDFPLQWGYTDAPAFVDEAQRQMRDMIELLYNHPSIVVWCAHNEAPWDATWMADRDPRYSPVQNKRLDGMLQDLARKLDPTRYVHTNSGSGDSHPYPGWYYGQWSDFNSHAGISPGEGSQGLGAETPANRSSLSGAPFVTEYGAQALPNLEMMLTMFAPQELNYAYGEVRDRWEFHDFQPRETFQNVGIDPGESIEEFIANSQAYQANLIQFATESYRRAKYNPMQGIFHFMFVDNWPSITWSVLDYDRQPKMGFYALQTAMQPILPSISATQPARLEGHRWVYTSAEDIGITLWAVNDTLEEYPKAQLNWNIEGENGQTGTFGQIEVDILADTSQQVWKISTDRLSNGQYTLIATLSSADGQVLGENQFEFHIQPESEKTNQ